MNLNIVTASIIICSFDCSSETAIRELFHNINVLYQDCVQTIPSTQFASR